MAPVGDTEIWALIITNAALLSRDIIKLLKTAMSKGGNGGGTKVDVRVGASGNQAQNGGGGNGKQSLSSLCLDHEKRISKAEEQVEFIQDWRLENSKQHREIFDALKRLGA